MVTEMTDLERIKELVSILNKAGKSYYSDVWQRINQVAKNESLAALPKNTTQKIRFRLLNKLGNPPGLPGDSKGLTV